MKKYFFYLLFAVITSTFLGLMINFSGEIKNKVFEKSLVQAYGGGCEAQYCYSAANDQPCPDDAEIKSNQLTIASQRDYLLYLRNRALAEREDLTEDLEIINEKIEWYEDKIETENEVLSKLNEGAEKDLQEEIIKGLEEEKEQLEAEKDYKEELEEKLDELAIAIAKIKDPITNLASLPDQCLTNVKEECSGRCEGGCHDEEKCAPDECSGGNPCPADEIQSQVDEIKSITQKIREIADEIIEIISEIGEEQVTAEACQNPKELAQENDVPYPAKRAASLETLLNCISSQTGQSLPSENGSNQFYGSLYTYEHTNELCNYTRGNETCGNCAHALYSCHYGGSSGFDGSLAIDFGNEDNGDRIIAAALQCGAKNARCEGTSSATVSCGDPSANHVHITDQNCDKN